MWKVTNSNIFATQADVVVVGVPHVLVIHVVKKVASVSVHWEPPTWAAARGKVVDVMEGQAEAEVPEVSGWPDRDSFAAMERVAEPVVMRGAISSSSASSSPASSWPACEVWDPHKDGIDHLRKLAGDAEVDAMVAPAGACFDGDVRAHMPVRLAFGDMLDGAEEAARDGHDDKGEEEKKFHKEQVSLYLAQAPMFSMDTARPSPLRALLDDIRLPELVAPESLNAVNFWMSLSGSRSSLHYDPYQNFLCVVAGSKSVSLYPPSCASALRARPCYEESANHTYTSIPTSTTPPNAPNSLLDPSKRRLARLRTGDVLFLPEGWFHQVESAGLTIAVNVWWQSEAAKAVGRKETAGFYARQAVRTLVEVKKQDLLAAIPKYTLPAETSEAERVASEVLIRHTHSVIALNLETTGEELPVHTARCAPTLCPIEQVLQALPAKSVRRVLYAMPSKVLSALVRRALTPAAAELLTLRFEEADEADEVERENEVGKEVFYEKFHGSFGEDNRLGMNALIDGKETFAAWAYKHVVFEVLGPFRD